jgi:hypothetical protein
MDDLFLALVVAIEGWSGTTDALGQFPHGKALDPIGEIEVAGAPQYLFTFYAHGVNNVNKVREVSRGAKEK